MGKTFKGYYLPKSMEDIEKNLSITEKKLDDAIILTPKISVKEAEKIVIELKKNQEKIAKIPKSQIASFYSQISNLWKQTEDYEKKKDALKYLPKLTNLSSELIEYYQFRSIYKINEQTISFLTDFDIPIEIFKEFTHINETNSWLRAYSGISEKRKLKKSLESPKELKLVTYISPKNVPGFIEALGIFLGQIVNASVLIKTPSAQPLFAPLYAESIAEVSFDLGETIGVIPWSGGNEEIENAIFKNSDVVSIVSSTEAANSVKNRIKILNNAGYDIKGTYHGGKFGFEIVAREFLTDEETARKVAKLTAIDGVGYEGYMCASPAFGFFIEEGGKITPERFAELLSEEAAKLSDNIPQLPLFRKMRERKVAEILTTIKTSQRLISTPKKDYAILYEPEAKLLPTGQNRLFKVMPIKDIKELYKLVKPWSAELQTAGIAITNERLFVSKIAEEFGKLGVSNFRICGTVPLPRLGEAWDGNFPILEFFISDKTHWVSVNGKDVREEITKLSKEYDSLIEKGVFSI